MTAAPKASELQSIATASLVADSYFAGLSAGITVVNPGTSDSSMVLMDDGLQEATIKRHLRESGICVIVEPLLGAKLRDQSGPQFVLDCDLLVKVVVAVERNSDTERGGAGAVPVDAVAAVARVLTTRTRHPGGEFFRLGATAFEMDKFDQGLLGYDVFFTKEARL